MYLLCTLQKIACVSTLCGELWKTRIDLASPRRAPSLPTSMTLSAAPLTLPPMPLSSWSVFKACESKSVSPSLCNRALNLPTLNQNHASKHVSYTFNKLLWTLNLCTFTHILWSHESYETWSERFISYTSWHALYKWTIYLCPTSWILWNTSDFLFWS